MKSFFVFGVPRSGTTLLCNILNSQDGAACLVEPHLYMKVHGWYEDEKHSFESGTDPVEFLEGRGYLYGGFKETFRKPWVANHLVNFDEVNRYVELVDFSVAIIRDIRAVWVSTINTWNSKRNGLLKYCKCWNNFCDFIESRSILTVKYEDLVLNPQNCRLVFERFDFEVDVNRPIQQRDTEYLSPHDAHKIKNIHSNSIEKWKSVITESEQQQIENFCGENMKKWEYI